MEALRFTLHMWTSDRQRLSGAVLELRMECQCVTSYAWRHGCKWIT